MSMISKALVDSPIVRFTPEERTYRGDGIPRDFSGKPLDWFLQMQAEGATWEE